MTVKHSFNTQPPEGGWGVSTPGCGCIGCFNTQPPEGGWAVLVLAIDEEVVSTHSRPKAAGSRSAGVWYSAMFQHTAARRRLAIYADDGTAMALEFQHTAARRRLAAPQLHAWRDRGVSTHSRPKAAGPSFLLRHSTISVSTHSRPKAAGCACRLAMLSVSVSTHSRPKAAGKNDA